MAPLRTFCCCRCGYEFSYFTEEEPIECPKCKTATAFYEIISALDVEMAKSEIAKDYSLPLDERMAAAKGERSRGLAGQGFISEHPTMQK